MPCPKALVTDVERRKFIKCFVGCDEFSKAFVGLSNSNLLAVDVPGYCADNLARLTLVRHRSAATHRAP